jgi:hypothetical protein
VRIFIGALTDKSLLTGSPTAMAVAFHASLFGQIAKSFKINFIDSLDKLPNRDKTYERVLNFLIS